MQVVYVWILVLASSRGGVTQVPNISSWEDCERLRLRAQAIAPQYTSVNGSCTQVRILVSK